MNDQDKQLIDELNGIMKEFMQDLDAKLLGKQNEINQLKKDVKELEARITSLETKPKKGGHKKANSTSPTQPHQSNSGSSHTTTASGLNRIPSQPAESYSGILGQIKSSPSFINHKDPNAQTLLQNVAKEYPESATEPFTHIHLWLILLLKHLELNRDDNQFKQTVKDNFDQIIAEYSIKHSCDPSFLNGFINWIDRQQVANPSAFRNIYLIGGVYSTPVKITRLIEIIKTMFPHQSAPEHNSSS